MYSGFGLSDLQILTNFIGGKFLTPHIFSWKELRSKIILYWTAVSLNNHTSIKGVLNWEVIELQLVNDDQQINFYLNSWLSNCQNVQNSNFIKCFNWISKSKHFNKDQQSILSLFLFVFLLFQEDSLNDFFFLILRLQRLYFTIFRCYSSRSRIASDFLRVSQPTQEILNTRQKKNKRNPKKVKGNGVASSSISAGALFLHLQINRLKLVTTLFKGKILVPSRNVIFSFLWFPFGGKCVVSLQTIQLSTNKNSVQRRSLTQQQ